MKILVIGGGAREHALAWRLSSEPDVEQVLCAPGNPGIASVAHCIPANPADPNELLRIAEHFAIDVTGRRSRIAIEPRRGRCLLRCRSPDRWTDENRCGTRVE
jgi:hypothetical protein